MRNKQRVIVSIAAAGLLFGTVASAQFGGSRAPGATTDFRTVGDAGFRGAFRGRPRTQLGGWGSLPFGRGLALGTTMQIRTYEAEPEEGAEPTQTLDFIVGEDSEVAFIQELTEAQEGAAFMVVATGEQTLTVDLPDADDTTASTLGSRRHAPRLGFGLPLNGLELGDTVSATFFGGDPAEGGAELQTLTFTFGESSAVGFQAELAAAAAEADFVVVTLPPQERVVDLSASDRFGARRGPGPGSD